ncbi:MAG: LamG-like jellyroll fold domain-containing protein [Phormidesmis sp.]
MNYSKELALQLQGNLELGNWKVSTTGTLMEAGALQLETFEAVMAIVKQRERSKQRSLVTVVIGEEDFVPVSFLEKGIQKSAAVCRIARYFDLPSFRAFVKELAIAINKLGNSSHNFDSIAKVSEVFSIPQQVADEFFTEAVRQQIGAGDETALCALQNITETQLAKILPIPIGTGFLVGGSHLLTNHHVVPTVEIADQCVAQFSFVESLKGPSKDSVDYELNSSFFVSNPDLDYTLVQLKSNLMTQQAGYEFGWIQLVEDSQSVSPHFAWVEFQRHGEQDVTDVANQGKAHIDKLLAHGYTVSLGESLIIWHPDSGTADAKVYQQPEIEELALLMGQDSAVLPRKQARQQESPGDSVIIVQHPKGRRKQVVLNNNRVVANGLYKDFLRYEADTDYGSSGSPVFNASWELVGLHHAAVPKKVEDSAENDLQPVQQSQSGFSVEIDCHQGVRICRIIADLKQKSVRNSKLRGFIDDFVTTQEQLSFPPLPAALTFDGINDYIDLTQPSLADKPDENAVKDFSQFSIEAWVSPYLSDANTTIFSQFCTEPWYEEFSQDSAFGEYLLSLEITPECNVVFSRQPRWQFSPSRFPRNGLLYPYLMVGSTKGKHPLDVLVLPNTDPPQIEIKSDDPTQVDKMKALQIILYCLGFFTKKDNLDRTTENRENYFNAVSGELDESTKAAIQAFNSWVIPTIAIEAETVIISADVIDIFNKKGINLGSGTNQEKDADTKEKIKDHYGPRVLELQHCLKSLDWQNNPFLKNSPFCTNIHSPFSRRHRVEVPEVELTGHFSWLDTPDVDPQKTTAYAVKTLQQASRQYADGIVGSLSLAALADAKTYQVSSRESLPLGEFSHVAVTFDGEEIKIYINGQLSNRRYTGKHSVGHIRQTLIGARPRTFDFDSADGNSVGSSNSNSQSSERNAYFEEAISEVRLWNKSLTAADIGERLHRRLGDREPDHANLMGYWRLEEGKLEDERSQYQLEVAAMGDERELPTAGESLVFAAKVDSRYYVRIFDSAKRLVVDGVKDELFVDEKLASQFQQVLSGQSSDSDKTRLLQEIALRCGHSLHPYYVYNYAGAASPYATKSKFHNQDINNAILARSACRFPTVPLPFGLKLEKALALTVPQQLPDSMAAEIARAAAPAEAGITVECWIKHEHGDGVIMSGGNAETGLYVLRWIQGKIQLMLKLNNPSKNNQAEADLRSPTIVKIETQAPVANAQVWHHIAFSWGAVSQEVNLYLEGKRQNVVALEADVYTLSYRNNYNTVVRFAVTQFALQSKKLTLVPKNEQGEEQDFCCSMAELRLWRVARPQSLIKDYLYQHLSADAEGDLMAYWRFDQKDKLVSQINQGTRSLIQQVPRGIKEIISENKTFEFWDVDKQHWGACFIEELQKAGLLGAFVDTAEMLFRPDATMTRQTFAVILLNTFGGKPKADRANTILNFKDKSKIESKYLADIEYVWRLGLISGDVIQENTKEPAHRGTLSSTFEITFNPCSTVTRGVAISAIFDSLREVWDSFSTLANDDIDPMCEQTLALYEDVPSAPQPFCKWIPRKRIAIALQHNLIVHKNASSPTLDLDAEASRAEIAAILYQALVIQGRVQKPVGSDRIMKADAEWRALPVR